MAASNVSKTYGNSYTFDTTTPSSDFSVTGLKNSDTVASVALSSAGTSDSDVYGARAGLYDHGWVRLRNGSGQLQHWLVARDLTITKRRCQ